MSDGAVIYEILNKETWEVKQQDHLEFADGVVNFHAVGGEVIVFQNPQGDGQLSNDGWLIRAVGTHNEPDGVGTVEVPA